MHRKDQKHDFLHMHQTFLLVLTASPLIITSNSKDYPPKTSIMTLPATFHTLDTAVSVSKAGAYVARFFSRSTHNFLNRPAPNPITTFSCFIHPAYRYLCAFPMHLFSKYIGLLKNHALLRWRLTFGSEKEKSDVLLKNIYIYIRISKNKQS